MNKEQALQVIEQALNISAQKGVFGLQDSATVLSALNVLKQPEPKESPRYDLDKPGKLAGTFETQTKKER